MDARKSVTLIKVKKTHGHLALDWRLRVNVSSDELRSLSPSSLVRALIIGDR